VRHRTAEEVREKVCGSKVRHPSIVIAKRFNAFAVLRPELVYPDLLTPTRERLLASGVPWVMENVPGAPMSNYLTLCGSQFGLGVRRHRYFETGWPLFDLMPPCDHSRPTVCVVGHGGGSGKGTKVKRWRHAEGAEAMGIDWMTRDALTQAIPPAYTEYLGGHLLAEVERRAAA
jgi:DNA (cytosine-5)-methyltransferase 1